MYKRAVLDLEETQVMDELLAIMQRFEGWGLRANVLEMTAAIHTLQSFVVQHMLARIEPSLWSDWYITAGKGERSRANIRMEHILEPATPVSPTAPSARPRITADEPRKKPAPVKAGMSPPQHRTGRKPRGDVLVGCGLRAKRPTVILRFSEAVAETLGLGPGPVCECNVEQVGKTLLVRPGRGLHARKPATARQFLLRLATAERWGSLGLHPSEVCAWHFDSENRLVIQAPAWLPTAVAKAPVPVSRPQVRSEKEKDAPPASCKKMAGTNPTIKCAACQKATATVECSRCPTLLCDACWDPHVRVHWHAKAGDKAITAARDARHAMRKDA